MTVLVVGGGITGLTAAYELGRAGISTTLIEATDRLGGKVRTDHVDGFLVESGPDSFISYRPAALELCRELGLADSIIRPTEPRTVNVRVGGRFVRLPDGMGLVLPTRMRPFVTTRMFSPLEKLRMGLDLVLPRDGRVGDVAVGAFLRRRLGRALVERLAGPLIGGVYGTPIDELSLDAVVPQLREAERRYRSLLLASLAQGRARRASGAAPRAAAGSTAAGPAAAGGESPGAGSSGGGSPFVTLAGGTGQLIDALVAAIGTLPSVDVRTRTRATGVVRRNGRTSPGGLDVVLDGGELLQPDVVILATPAPVAAGIVESVAPETARHLRSIPYGSTAVVSLGYRVDQFPEPPTGHGFLVADGEPLSISACTLSSLKWTDRAPAGAVLMRAFIGSSGERLLAGSDDEVIAAAVRDVELTTGVRGAPLLARVARWPGAMPHYTVGHLDRVAATIASLEGLPALILAGAAYRGVGLPDCIAQGRGAAARAQALLAGSADGTPADDPATTRAGASGGEAAALPLDRLPIGGSGRVVSVEPVFRDELADEGVRPGADLSVSAAAPFGGPLVVLVGQARVALARSVASTVHVAVESASPERRA